MEKKNYQILQDWHELLKSGVITEAEFVAKKKELLGGEKKAQTILSREIIPIHTQEEQAYIDAEYDALFNKKTWVQKNKSWLIFTLLLLLMLSAAYFYNSRTLNKAITDETMQSIEPSGEHQSNSMNLVSEMKPVAVDNGTYLLLQDFDCDISKGTLIIDKLGNGKFHFTISVNGPDTGSDMIMEGSIDGIANFVSKTEAIYHDVNCKSLKFKFFEASTVRIYESDCNYYHGSAICFGASFIKTK
jgi:hypothetical protein